MILYAKNNHITYLALYDLGSVLGNAAREALLCDFMKRASNSCIEKFRAVSSCSSLFNDVGIVAPTDPYPLQNTARSGLTAQLGFVQSPVSTSDPEAFFRAESAKLFLRATDFNDNCLTKFSLFV